jgi:hypothetical protein
MVKNPVEPPESPHGGPNICVVTPPQSYQTDAAKNAGANLSLFGSKGISVGAKAEFDTKVGEVFQEVPDAAVACAMLLQTVACLSSSSGNAGAVTQLLDIVYQKNTCSSPTQFTASGQIVYIQTSSTSQTPVTKTLLDELGAKGFLAYGPDLQSKGESPNDAQIRLFYQSDFEAAKLIRTVMQQAGINTVLIKPQYNWKPDKKPKPGKLEIWLPEVSQQASK